MKKIILSLAIALSGYYSYAQNVFPTPTGNVGIGTTTPGNSIAFQDLTSDSGTSGITWFSPDPLNYGISKTAGLWSGPNYTQMAIRWMGGIQLNPGTAGAKSYVDIGGNGLRVTSGYVGIGTTSPQRKLDLSNAGQLTFGDDVVTNSTNGIYWHSGDHYGIYRTTGDWTGNAYQQLRIQFDTGIQLAPGPDVNSGYGKSYVEIVTGKGLMVSSGSVGIGTTDTKGYSLAVNGSAIATSMTVKLYANWPDYVFKPNYHLPSLTTVKAYIDQNQHLPEMPSEQEVKDNGINLGEIVKVQTKKIEELTLYLIEKDKQLTKQKNKNDVQDARIAALEKALLKQSSKK